jgi:hypothetical protein
LKVFWDKEHVFNENSGKGRIFLEIMDFWGFTPGFVPSQNNRYIANLLKIMVC